MKLKWTAKKWKDMTEHEKIIEIQMQTACWCTEFVLLMAWLLMQFSKGGG